MTSWRGVALSMLAAAALAGGATWLVMQDRLPSEGADAADARYPLAPVEFTDPLPVTVTYAPAPQHDVFAPRSGVITAARCTDDTPVRTGDTLYDIDQQPVVAFVTDAPLFRDLREGETGADVEAVQRELTALGYGPVTSGRYDWPTMVAMRDFHLDRGTVATAGDRWALTMGNVLWVPSSRAVIAQCYGEVGEPVTTASALLTLSTGAGSLTFTPPRAATGDDLDRALVVDDTRVAAPVSPITDPEAVMAIITTPSGRAATTSTEKSLQATWELAKPVPAYAVPPSALVGIEGDSACVLDGATPHPVTIVASSLGLSYVTFAGGPPDAVDAFPSTQATCS